MFLTTAQRKKVNMTVRNSSKVRHYTSKSYEELFYICDHGRKTKSTFARRIFSARFDFVPTNCPWVSEDAITVKAEQLSTWHFPPNFLHRGKTVLLFCSLNCTSEILSIMCISMAIQVKRWKKATLPMT